MGVRRWWWADGGDIFTLLDLDPDPHFAGVSGSRRENECGSIRIRIHSPGPDPYQTAAPESGTGFGTKSRSDPEKSGSGSILDPYS